MASRSFARTIGRKIANALVTLFLVLIINFFLFRIMPGNPIRMMIPQRPNIPPEYVDMMIHKHGLDQPLHIQFLTYLWNTLHLDFGDSFRTNTPVNELVMNDLTWTLILVGTSTFFMILIGLTIGIISAWKRGSYFDTGSLAFSLFFYAMPTFWFGIILIMVFSLNLQWFPPAGQLPITMELRPFTLETLSGLLYHLVLPAICLTIGSIAAFSVVIRSSLVDIMTEDYITTARAKGVSEMHMLRHHAVPNAMLPVVTLIALDLAFVVAGAFQVEYVFNYQGIGYATVRATAEKDYPYLQAAFFIIAVAVIFANLIADIALVYFDPRVRVE